MNIIKKVSALAALGVLVAVPASAGTFPEKPIELVVPYSPGGGSDVSARVFAECLSGHLPEKVVVKNITGGAGAVAENTVLKERPTGYVLLWQHQSLHALSARGVTAHAPKDFEVVAQTAFGPWGIFAGADAPADDIKSLREYVSANPGKIRVGAALGGLSHFAGLVFMGSSDIDISKTQIIGLSGGKNRIVAILQGNLDMAPMSVAAARPYVKSGKMKSIAILAPERVDAMPDQATAAEQGAEVSYGVNWITWAPKGTPKDRLDILRKAWKAAASDEKCKSNFAAKAMMAVYKPEDAVDAYNESEMAVYKGLVKKYGMK